MDRTALASPVPAVFDRTPDIEDRSLWPRIGVKGAGLRAWLKARGLPDRLSANRAACTAENVLLAMLADNEALIAAPPDYSLPGFMAGRSLAERVWPVPRDFGTFQVRLAEARAAAVLPRLCDIALTRGRFAEGAVAQTLLAGACVIIVRADAAYHLFGDATYADFIAHELAAVM